MWKPGLILLFFCLLLANKVYTQDLVEEQIDEVIDNDDIDVTTEVAPLATLSPDEVEEPNQEVFDEKKEKDPGCHTDLSGASGSFVTENFPEEYPVFSNCTWNITVSEGQRVKLTFHLFNVELNNQCMWDWVKIIDSNGTVIKHICGYLQQDLILYSTNNSLQIHFYSDNTINAAGFLASWAEVSDVQAEITNEVQNRGYVLSFPQSFTVSEEDSTKEQLCLQLLNVNSNGQVSLSLYSANDLVHDNATVTVKVDHEAGDDNIHCYDLGLPGVGFDKHYAIVGIKANFPDEAYTILSYKSVRVLKTQPLTLIQTDKYDYRPGQEVKARILLMTEELKPSKKDSVEEIWIQDPSGSRLEQWRELYLNKAIGEFSYRLPDEPTLGKWTIMAKVSNQTKAANVLFEVNEQVLPTYEVTLAGPKFMLKDSQEEEFMVCAKYTHGAKVKGAANVTFSTRYRIGNYYRAPWTTKTTFKIIDLVDGCAQVVLNSTEVQDLVKKSSPIKLVAVVKEAGTGEKQNTTINKIEVKKTPFVIKPSGNKDLILGGGFPYTGQFQVVDHGDKPVANVALNICTRLYTSLQAMKNYVNNNNHRFYSFLEEDFYKLSQKMKNIKFKEVCADKVTDANGAIDFAVSLSNIDIPANITKLSIRAAAVDFPANATTEMEQPVSLKDVSLTHSNASSALTISSVQAKLVCGDNQVSVFVSAPAETDIELTHFLASGGAMVASGSTTVAMGQTDQMQAYIGDSQLIEFQPDPEDRQGQAAPILVEHKLSFNRPLALEGKLSSKFKLLAYVRDVLTGETLTSSEEFDAESCSSKPKLVWSVQELNPGNPVNLKLEGPPEGLCGFSVVDKSVTLVPNPNKITESKLQDLREAFAKKRIVNDRVKGEKCQDARLLFKAFEKLGLFIMSDKLQENTACDTLIDVTNLQTTSKEHFNEYEDDGGPIAFAAAPQANIQFAAAPQANVQALMDYDDGGADFGAPPKAQFAVNSNNRVNYASRPPPSLHKEVSSTTSSRTESVRVPTIELRNYFPETWLFELVDLDTDGQYNRDINTPHTITTWIGETFCTHESTGVAVSEPANLLVKQDFFVDLKLPYSVKRGEILPVNISAFNSLDQRSLPLKLSVLSAPFEEYKLGRSEAQVCLNAQDSHTETFTVKMKTLEKVNITVEARIEGQTGCEEAGSAEGYADTVEKSIQVKPEGYPIEKVDSEFICRKPDEQTTVLELDPLELPADLVEDSARAWTSVSGDVLAPSLANLDKLVNMPYGCGEQNMISMVPNIYVVNYLMGTGQDKPELVMKAKKYMKAGYERQEKKYRHKDGSYSVWGPTDDEAEGSVWLTSFVVKAFSQASKYIDVDSSKIRQSMYWLYKRQDPQTGCFKNEGFNIHSEFKGDQVALTAGLIITMLEDGKIEELIPMLEDGKIEEHYFIKEKSMSLENGLKCVAANITAESDIYSKTLVAYAMALDESQGYLKRSNELLNELIEVAKDDKPGKLYWKNDLASTLASSKDVEVTAYNVLTLIQHDRLPEAQKAIRWLATQRNSRGGFKSTQDTMVALQAMSQYSLKVTQQDNSLHILVSSGSSNYNFDVKESNKLLLRSKKMDLNPTDNKVSVEINGGGCVIVQTLLRYNVQNSPNKKSFELNVIQNEDDEIEMCSKYTGTKDVTNMVVIEVELLSGFEPLEGSLETLKANSDVKKFEYDTEENTVALYYNDMPKEEICNKFTVVKKVDIKELKPAIVKIYDYYNQEDIYSTEYTIIEK